MKQHIMADRRGFLKSATQTAAALALGDASIAEGKRRGGLGRAF